jgi:hypothetical protein
MIVTLMLSVTTTDLPPPFDWRQFLRACAFFGAVLIVLKLLT